MLAAAGYIAARAHVNSLGIAMTESLGLERYLATAWLLVQDLALRAIPITLLVLLLQYLGGLWSKHIPSFLKKGVGRGKPGGASHHGALLLLAVLSAILVASFYFWVEDSKRIDLAMGPLSATRGYGLARPAYLFEAALIFLVLGALLHARSTPSTLTTLHRVTWGVLLMTTPVIYGVVVHPDRYPLARVIPASGDPVCGFLVMQGPESVSLWVVESRYARTIRLKHDDVSRLELGPTASLTEQLKILAPVEQPPVASTAGLCTTF